MAGSTTTVPPPVEDIGALNDSMRPTGSVNPGEPVMTPVLGVGTLLVTVPEACGVPAPTDTVTNWRVPLTPLFAVTVNVSVVDAVAACRWDCVGV